MTIVITDSAAAAWEYMSDLLSLPYAAARDEMASYALYRALDEAAVIVLTPVLRTLWFSLYGISDVHMVDLPTFLAGVPGETARRLHRPLWERLRSMPNAEQIGERIVEMSGWGYELRAASEQDGPRVRVR